MEKQSTSKMRHGDGVMVQHALMQQWAIKTAKQVTPWKKFVKSKTSCFLAIRTFHYVYFKTRCHGKESCTIQTPFHHLFGDPCIGTYKYLKVAYDCIGTGRHLHLPGFRARVHVINKCFKVPQGSWGTFEHLFRTWTRMKTRWRVDLYERIFSIDHIQ